MNVTTAVQSVCRFVIERVAIPTVYPIVTRGTVIVAAAAPCTHRAHQFTTSSVMAVLKYRLI